MMYIQLTIPQMVVEVIVNLKCDIQLVRWKESFPLHRQGWIPPCQTLLLKLRQQKSEIQCLLCCSQEYKWQRNCIAYGNSLKKNTEAFENCIPYSVLQVEMLFS